MSKPEQVAVDLDPETLADVDRIAAEWGKTRGHVLTTAVLRFVMEEARLLPPDPDDPLAQLPPHVETDPLALALNEAEDKAREAFDAYMKVGEDDIEAGRVVDHEDFMREMRERYRSRSAA